ncbi:MAG: hypothetical protein LPK02_07370 [Rhodobacterales bacterium]|nr:hypothetical protein [Rhodobacterales bacterium]
MPKYRVTTEETVVYEVTVEAQSETHAKQIVSDMIDDMEAECEFIEVDSSAMEVVDAFEVRT